MSKKIIEQNYQTYILADGDASNNATDGEKPAETTEEGDKQEGEAPPAEGEAEQVESSPAEVGEEKKTEEVEGDGEEKKHEGKTVS